MGRPRNPNGTKSKGGYSNTADRKKMICQKCGRPQWDNQYFYSRKDGSKYPVCKDCLTAHIDNRDPNTFLWILKEFDVPYIETIWNSIFNKQYMKNPAKFNGRSVLGLYLRTMRISQYMKYTFADSEKFMSARTAQAKKIKEDTGMSVEEYEEDLKNKLMKGEITETEYHTLSPLEKTDTEILYKQAVTQPSLYTSEGMAYHRELEKTIKKAEELATKQNPLSNITSNLTPQEIANKAIAAKMTVVNSAPSLVSSARQLQPTMTAPIGSATPLTNPVALGQAPPLIPDVVGVNESELQSELTPEDIKYLSIKWGIHYKPSEWVALEDLFQKYAAEYELSVDREQVLKNICRTSLKMDQALDVGDIKSYRDLAAVFEQMRKSGKFTEAQAKEEVKRDIDSIGELVAFVEQEGGAIPAYDNPIDYPKDKVDFCIKDMKSYLDHLVKDDLGLSGLIESYLMKADSNKAKSVDDIIKDGFKTKEELELEALKDNRTFEELFEEEAKRVFALPYWERHPYGS